MVIIIIMVVIMMMNIIIFILFIKVTRITYYAFPSRMSFNSIFVNCISHFNSIISLIFFHLIILLSTKTKSN